MTYDDYKRLREVLADDETVSTDFMCYLHGSNGKPISKPSLYRRVQGGKISRPIVPGLWTWAQARADRAKLLEGAGR